MLFLQAGNMGKYAYLASKAYRQNESFFDTLFESPIFWAILILGVIIIAAVAWQKGKNN